MNCFDFVHFLTPAIHKITLYSGESRNFKRECCKLKTKKSYNLLLNVVENPVSYAQTTDCSSLRISCIYYKLFPFHARLGGIILVCLLLIICELHSMANYIVNNIYTCTETNETLCL